MVQVGVFDVVNILQFVHEHKTQLEEFAGTLVMEELACLEHITEALCVEYVMEVNRTAVGMLKNLRTVEEPEIDEDGLCSSELPNDLFKIVWENTEFAQSSQSRRLVVRTVSGALVPAIRTWLDKFAAVMHDEGLNSDLEYLCCVLNNVERCFQFGANFEEDMAQKLEDDELCAQLFWDQVDTAFARLAKTVSAELCGIVYDDLQESIAFVSRPLWVEDSMINKVLDTVVDFFEDMQSWMMPRPFQKVVTNVLTQLSGEYLKELLTLRKHKSKFLSSIKFSAKAADQRYGTAEFIDNDLERMTEVFSRYLREQVVCRRLLDISKISKLYACSISDFTARLCLCSGSCALLALLKRT